MNYMPLVVSTVLILVFAIAVYFAGVTCGRYKYEDSKIVHGIAGVLLLAVGLSVLMGVLGEATRWIVYPLSATCIVFGLLQFMFIWFPPCR